MPATQKHIVLSIHSKLQIICQLKSGTTVHKVVMTVGYDTEKKKNGLYIVLHFSVALKLNHSLIN